jgi:RNA polymerase sigma-70 factor (ECF subfamily)
MRELLTKEFEDLLAPLLGPAYGTALHLTRNPADAEDLVQEAAFLAFRSFHTFTPGTRFKAWYFQILMNAFRHRWRRRKREPETVDVGETTELFLFRQAAALGLTTTSPDPAAEVMAKIGAEQVERAIDSLPEEFREATTLYFLEEFSYEEIAGILDCPVGTVRSRLHRGRKLLQRALWDAARESGIVGGIEA